MHSDNAFLLKKTYQRQILKIHATHHHVQWIQFVEIKVMSPCVNVFLAISEIHPELGVILSVWLVQIVLEQSHALIINALIHARMSVDTELHAKQ